MKKLSICRNCKRRFLIEPGRDNCPKCGGPLYKTDLEEQYWELYTEDQRAELISRLMVEMEQKAGAGTNGTAGQSGAGAYGSAAGSGFQANSSGGYASGNAGSQNTNSTGGYASGNAGSQGGSGGGYASGAASSQAKSSAGSTASQAAGSVGSAFKNPAILLGTVAGCILLVVAAITISGNMRRSAGSETGAGQIAESVNASASAGGAGSMDESKAANPEPEEKRVELFRDQEMLITRSEEKDFPYTDESGSVIFEFRIKNLSDHERNFSVDEFLMQGIQFDSGGADIFDVKAGESRDLLLTATPNEIRAAGIDNTKDAAFKVLVRDSGEWVKEVAFETEGYDASSKPEEKPEELIYSDDEIDIYFKGAEVAEVPALGLIEPQFCYYLLFKNKSDEEKGLISIDNEVVKLNGREMPSEILGAIAPDTTAIAWDICPIEGYLPKGEEIQTAEVPMTIQGMDGQMKRLLLTIENKPDGSQNVFCNNIDELNPEAAESSDAASEAGTDAAEALTAQDPEGSAAGASGSSGTAGSSDAEGSSEASETSGASGASGKTVATQPYVYKDMVIDLPMDAVPMPQGNKVYAFLYTKDNMDVIILEYIDSPPNLDAVRSITKERFEEVMAGMGIPGYDGILSFSHSETDGYPVITLTYHMGDDNLFVVTEKSIYTEKGIYNIQTHDITGENTDVLTAARDSVRLVQQ